MVWLDSYTLDGVCPQQRSRGRIGVLAARAHAPRRILRGHVVVRAAVLRGAAVPQQLAGQLHQLVGRAIWDRGTRMSPRQGEGPWRAPPPSNARIPAFFWRFDNPRA